MMKTSRLSAALMTSVGMLLAFSAASPDCWAQNDSDVYLNSDGDFNTPDNWDLPLRAPGTNAPGTDPVDVYGIDDGRLATFSGGTTKVFGLRVGSGAKEHYVGNSGDTHFGRLTMEGGTLEVIGNVGDGVFAVGRERQNKLIGADYNKDSVVDAADYTVWRNTLGSMSGFGCAANASTSDFCADGSGPTPGVPDGVVDTHDYDYWKAGYGNFVKGGEFIMTGMSTLTANGVIIGDRTKGLLSVGPEAFVDLKRWVTVDEPPILGSHFSPIDTADMRIGTFGPAAELFLQPGVDGNGLVDVQGRLNANTVFVSANGGKGEIRLSGGTVNLNGALIMSFCESCYVLPAPSDPDYPVILAWLALQSSKVSIIGSSGTFNVGLDADPLTPDPNLISAAPFSRDIRFNYVGGDFGHPMTATFSFTADAGGVTPITVVDNGLDSMGAANLSGTAFIAGTKLELNLDTYAGAGPLTLINAAPGHLSGTFGTVTFLGSRMATVNYDVANGDVFLSNFHSGAGSGGLAGANVPEPSGLVLIGTCGFFMIALGAGTNRQRARWEYQYLTIRA